MDELFRAAKELGIGIVGVGAIVWIAVYLIKTVVGATCSQLSTLVGELKIFMAKVRDEHDHANEQHKAMMQEHKEMIQILGRINEYKDQ
jgi:hypothetical protein